MSIKKLLISSLIILNTLISKDAYSLCGRGDSTEYEDISGLRYAASVPFSFVPFLPVGHLIQGRSVLSGYSGYCLGAVSFGAVGTTLGIILGFENTGDIPTALGMGLLYGGMAAFNGAMLIGYPLQIIDSIFQPIADDKVTLSYFEPELDSTSGLLGVKSISIAKLNFEF